MNDKVSKVKVNNIVAYSALIFIWSLQIVIVLAVIVSFIPIKLNSFVYTILPLYLDQVRPHRQLELYMAFIGFGIMAQIGGMIFLKKQLEDHGLAKALWPFVLMQAVWVLIESSAAFKIFVFGSPPWAKWLLYLSILGWLLNTIFWPEFKRYQKITLDWLLQPANAIRASRWFDGIIVIGVLILLWPTDITKLLAHIFVWDNCFHLDYFVMSPGWAYLHGVAIDVDVNSNYNVLIPAFLSTIAKYAGGFNYENVLRWIIIGTLTYYVAVWAFLRGWLKSSLLAAFGLLLAVKLQMFHWGVLPVLWRFPSATPVRYLFDLLPLFFVYKHSISGREKYLWLAAAASGLMMAYMMEVGIYLTIAFDAYLLMILTLPQMRGKFFSGLEDTGKILGLVVMPFVAAFMLLGMVEGQGVWTKEFWVNNTDYARLFLHGFQSLHIWDGLKDRQFFAFAMAFIIPTVYVLTIMIVGSLLYLNQTEALQMLVVYICVYGLGMYHYFIYRSAVTSYDVVSIPFVLVVCFWIQQILKPISLLWRRIILSLLVLLTLSALMTSYLFTYYPNALNLAGFDLGPELAFYKKEFNFDTDAALIDRLTAPEERVAVISSYETKILMQAERKPFFYYFPMIYPEPMGNLDFKGTELLTFDRVRKTLAQLDNSRPEYVFIEKKLFSGQLAPAYYQQYQTLTTLIRYLYQRYEPMDQGQYLLVLKRK